jgi:hypothetical protein
VHAFLINFLDPFLRMSSQKKPSASSKSTLWSVGEYDNNGMSLDADDDVFNASSNDLSLQNRSVRSSILRKPPRSGERSVSVGQLNFCVFVKLGVLQMRFKWL